MRSRALGHRCDAVLAAAFVLGCTPAAGRYAPLEVLPAAPLPAAFQPLTWTSEPESVQAAFPGAVLTRSPYRGPDGERVAVEIGPLVFNAELGDAVIVLDQRPDGMTEQIQVLTVDRREECYLEDDRRTPPCRNIDREQLLSLFRSCAQRLVAELGEPARREGRIELFDREGPAWTWEVGATRVVLDISPHEPRGQAMTLTALRGGR